MRSFFLFLLAITSFDAVIKFMTYPRWKWLHRFVYLGGVLILLHVWMIGTHLAYPGVQISAFGALALLLGLETHRATKLINDRYLKFDNLELTITSIAIWTIGASLLLSIPYFIKNYHSRHHSDTGSSSQHGGH